MWNSAAHQSFARPFGVHKNPVGERAFLTPGSPIFSRRGLPATSQFRHARRLFCYDFFLLGTRIDLNEQRLPAVCLCVPKRLKGGVAIAQENRLIVDS